MADKRRFVIVGASLAGAKAAETLRDDGFDGEVVLLGEESVRPYERPPLSKDYLRGEADAEKVFVHSAGFYQSHDIELGLSSKVTSVDPTSKQITLESGEQMRYDALLLTTGAEPRRLELAGAELHGVHYLRDLADSTHLREVISKTNHLVVIGAGWIGSEVAASARAMGAEVSVIEMASVPLERVLGAEIGRIFADLHVDHGVDLRLGARIECIEGADSVEAIRFKDGSSIETDAIVVGVGVTPRVDLAEVAGLKLDNGIVTDTKLATSIPGIWAAGDVANASHPIFERQIRLEHWSSALNQGPVAAKNMLGTPTPYEKVPYFFSDQYDLSMEYSGFATDWDAIVYRGDPASREFIAFWMKDGKVLAGMNVNVWDVADTIASLVASKVPVDVARLSDPAVDLASLVK